MSVKNDLQEFLQKRGCDKPTYKLEGNSGPPHRPVFKCSVSVQWKAHALCEMAEGRNKKAAEIGAAENMLRRLMDVEGCVVSKSPSSGSRQVNYGSSPLNHGSSPLNHGSSPLNHGSSPLYHGSSPLNHGSSPLLDLLMGGSRQSRHSGMVEIDGNDVSPMRPSRAKSLLQELLQKNRFPLPVYGECQSTGPAHQKVFTAPLEILSMYDSKKVVWHGSGRGKTKKEAESDVASQGLQFIQKKLDSDQLHLLRGAERRSPPREGVESGTDEYLQSFMTKYVIDTLPFRDDEMEDGGAGGWLCMQKASGGGLDLPIVSHGLGHTAESAQREATCNLIHSISSLSRLS